MESESDNRPHRRALESKIQKKLIKGLEMTPYTNSRYRLGRIETVKGDKLQKTNFILLNIPDEFDKRTKEILERL